MGGQMSLASLQQSVELNSQIQPGTSVIRARKRKLKFLHQLIVVSSYPEDGYKNGGPRYPSLTHPPISYVGVF